MGCRIVIVTIIFAWQDVIVAEDDYTQLKSSVNQLKRNVWPELSNPESVILHQMRLIEAEKGRLDAMKYPEYAKFNRCSDEKNFIMNLKRFL